jgi:hypothetical protein
MIWAREHPRYWLAQHRASRDYAPLADANTGRTRMGPTLALHQKLAPRTGIVLYISWTRSSARWAHGGLTVRLAGGGWRGLGVTVRM